MNVYLSHWILACIVAFFLTYTAVERAAKKKFDEDIDEALRIANEEQEDDD